MRYYPEYMNKLQNQPTTFAPQKGILNMPKVNQESFVSDLSNLGRISRAPRSQGLSDNYSG